MRFLPAAVTITLVVTGCSSKPDVSSSAIAVTVELAPESPATCVFVLAARDGNERTTEAIPRGGKNALRIAILAAGGDSGDVMVWARGYVSTDGCAQPRTLHEESEKKTAQFVPNEITQVTVRLTGVVAGDADKDGFVSTAAGGADCDDTDPDVNPSKPELCGNGKDDNCGGGTDCADTACNGQRCDDQSSCTDNDVCTAGACTGSAVLCATPPSSCHASPGTCGANGCEYSVTTGAVCDGGTCRSDGACVPGETLCGDTLDNDNDGPIDCADSDCDAQRCLEPAGCLGAATCASSSCGTPLPNCSTPPNGCFDPAGVCAAGTTCVYTPRAVGTGCGSGKVCGLDGGCFDDEVGPVNCASGRDEDGDGFIDCADPGCTLQTCDDGLTCTEMDSCSSNACSGTQVGCNSPTRECEDLPGTCSEGIGCSYAVRTGACDAGRCSPSGDCVPSHFPFDPSNFDQFALDVPDASVDLGCGATFMSNDTPVLTWCGGGPQPRVISIDSTDGGISYRMLWMDSLRIQTTGSLRLTGEHPVIIAVRKDAVIEGQINAGSTRLGTVGSGGSTTAAPGIWCASSAGANGTCGNPTQCGGGGGAGYAQAGGNGGNPSQGGVGGVGGQTFGANDLKPLLGGCHGGTGGTTSGGAGGGAVQLTAGGTLRVTGQIIAPGAGGGGASSNGQGGGGAGSGGAVLLEGYSVMMYGATVTANGGAGGEGEGESNGNAGQDGHADRGVALGGGGAAFYGGNGGDGGVRNVVPRGGSPGTSGTHRRRVAPGGGTSFESSGR